MPRTLALLLALVVLGPVACDDGSPGDDTDTATTTDDEDASTGEQEATGEAIEPTPIPFQPPVRKDCHYNSTARVGDCDP